MAANGYSFVTAAMPAQTFSSSTAFTYSGTVEGRYGSIVSLLIGATMNATAVLRVALQSSLDGVNWGNVAQTINSVSSITGTVAFSAAVFSTPNTGYVYVNYGLIRAPYYRVGQTCPSGTTAGSLISVSLFIASYPN